jgi:AraC-like DNA-binding protein
MPRFYATHHQDITSSTVGKKFQPQDYLLMNNSKHIQKLNRNRYFFPEGMAVFRINTARTTTAKMIFCVEEHPHSSIRSTAAHVHVSTSRVLRILKDQLHTKCVSKETATRLTDESSRPTQPMTLKLKRKELKFHLKNSVHK